MLPLKQTRPKNQVGCEGYDYPEDPFILKGSCQLVYSLKAPRSSRGGGGSAYSSSRQWEGGDNPTWDGRPAERWKRGAGAAGTERDLGSRLVTWAVLGVVGYVLYNTFVRVADEAPVGGGESRGIYLNLCRYVL